VNWGGVVFLRNFPYPNASAPQPRFIFSRSWRSGTNSSPYREARLFLTRAGTLMDPEGNWKPNSTAWPTIILTGIIADIPDSLMSTVRPWISSPLRLRIRRGTSKLNLECPRWSLANRLTINCPCYRLIKWHTPLRTNDGTAPQRPTRKLLRIQEQVWVQGTVCPILRRESQNEPSARWPTSKV
jgi:hypothetical protein